MNTPISATHLLPGAAWLIHESSAQATFIPEDFTEEQQMVKEMCNSFLDTEVLPIIERIDQLESGLMPSLIEKAGQQGLLGISVPASLGGMEKDFTTATLVNEGLGGGYSFSVAIAAHTGIGTLPILYFGTPAQQQQYIPKLATGEWKGAYGLTEPNSGSDALSAKTTARLSEDGKHYLLNGQKCWITNGGFADVYTVFAKIDGIHFTAFIVEKNFEGFTRGSEEHKMGIKGSSTVQLYFQDCKVPIENVLGEKGKGHLIAFNILNIGRQKLCAATLGGAQRAFKDSFQYAITREQFQQPIIHFGAIQKKLAEMKIRIWVCESALYRVTKLIEDKEAALVSEGISHEKAMLTAAEEYAIECAILKVNGSELLDFVADEGVQIHGGNGYSDEYLISKTYRDSRINRIYEGTNEINRLLTMDMMLKRAMKGKLDLLSPAMAVQKELMSIPDFSNSSEDPFENERKLLVGLKKTFLLTAGAAVQKLKTSIELEQEILMNLADIVIDIFLAESALLRWMKLTLLKGDKNCELEGAMVRVFMYDAAARIEKNSKDAIYAFAEGDESKMLALGIKRFTKISGLNTKALRRFIVTSMIQSS